MIRAYAARYGVRSSAIVADCDEAHAFPAVWSRGTWDTIRKARAAGKPTTVRGDEWTLEADMLAALASEEVCDG